MKSFELKGSYRLKTKSGVKMADDEGLSQIVDKFRSYVDGVSSLDIKDRPIILKYLCIDDGKLKWFGNLEDLKSFLESLVGLSGKWSSPGGDAKKFVCVERECHLQFAVTWYSKKQCSLVFQGDTMITEVVRSELLKIASKKPDVKNMFVQVADERLTLNCPTNDDKIISKEQCIDLTNKSLIALTDHSEVETELQSINDDLDVSLLLGPIDVGHPDCNDPNNNVANRPYASSKTSFCNCRCDHGEISADIEGIKLEMAILQNEINRGNANSNLLRLENTVKLFESKQIKLENTINHLEAVISNLQQENFLFQSKLTSLESLLFAPSPQTHVDNNLDDEMSVCITKESKKDGSNYSVVTSKQRIGSNYSDFIESTTKDPPDYYKGST